MKKFKITVDGQQYNVQVEEVKEEQTANTGQAGPAAPTSPSPVKTPPATKPAPAAGSGAVTAPMPGNVLKILVSLGDKVESGTPVLILDAMKMENNVNATRSGTVATIEIKQGQSVNTGQLLLTIE